MYRVTTHSVRANSAKARLCERIRANTTSPDTNKNCDCSVVADDCCMGRGSCRTGKAERS